MSDLGFVHRFIPGTSADAPLLVLLHGTGGSESDLLPLGSQVLPGAALLGVRGKVLENGIPRYFRRLAEGVFDLEDLKFRTAELAHFLRAAKTHYALEKRKMLALGYSNGANIAASLLLSHGDLFDGAVLLRAMVPFQPESAVHLPPIPVLLSAGEQDQIVPVTNTQALAELLKAAGAATAVHWHPGGHELGRDDLQVMLDWFTQHGFSSVNG